MGLVNQFWGGEHGKGRVWDCSHQAVQHSPEDPRGARIPPWQPLHLGIGPLITIMLLPLPILSPAVHRFRQIKFRPFSHRRDQSSFN